MVLPLYVSVLAGGVLRVWLLTGQMVTSSPLTFSNDKQHGELTLTCQPRSCCNASQLSVAKPAGVVVAVVRCTCGGSIICILPAEEAIAMCSWACLEMHTQ